MAKLTLTDPSAGYNSTSVIAANNALVEAAVENTLSRDGTAPNQMEAHMDLNSYRITNLADGINQQDAVTLAQLTGTTEASWTYTVENLNSDGAADGYVLTSDGADGAAWEDVVHDNLTGFVANEHIDHSSVTITAGAGLTGGGTLEATRTLNVGAGSGVAVNADDVAIDISGLTTIEGSALAATDIVLVDDGADGTNKAVQVQAFGLRVQTGQTTQDLAAADMNTIMEFTGTATLTLPLNSSVDLPVGVPIVLNVKHADQVLTVKAATSVTLVSVNHPGGGSAAQDTVDSGGSAILFKTADDVWVLSGDISD